MKHFLCVGLAMAIALAAFAGDDSDDAKLVQGNWKPVTAELAGQPIDSCWLHLDSKRHVARLQVSLG